MVSGMAPLKATVRIDLDAMAASASKSNPLVCPFDATVTAVRYIPSADVTGANTNTRRLAVVNKGLDGNGTTEVAALQFNSGVNAADFDVKDVPLTATVADRDVDEGEVLDVRSAAVGTGIAEPGGVVEIDLSRR